tara:strand:+ start:824 stop:1399 length:576 start_codon:yes stop_codon:yes gene_type:complete
MSQTYATFNSFIGSWAEDCCKPVGVPACKNLEKGFCPYGDRCHYSHKFKDFSWMLQATLNLNCGVVWLHIGKMDKIPKDVMAKIKAVIGNVNRVDYVRMPGNPQKGGTYNCAVMYIDAINRKPFQVLASGNCIRFKYKIRMQLFRGDLLPKAEVEKKQASQSASLQSIKAAKAANEVKEWMQELERCMFEM